MVALVDCVATTRAPLTASQCSLIPPINNSYNYMSLSLSLTLNNNNLSTHTHTHTHDTRFGGQIGGANGKHMITIMGTYSAG